LVGCWLLDCQRHWHRHYDASDYAHFWARTPYVSALACRLSVAILRAFAICHGNGFDEACSTRRSSVLTLISFGSDSFCGQHWKQRSPQQLKVENTSAMGTPNEL